MPAWDRSMKGLTTTAYPVAMASPLVTWVHGYLKKDKTMMRNGYKSIATISIAMCLSTGIKYLVQRERPFHQYPNSIVQREDHSGTYSFPSGHTTAAFATATSLSLSYKKWYVVVPSFAYAGFMGYSRMRLGMHYPSDVLGGMILGIGSGLLTWRLDRLLFQKRSD
jgi:membrane-associated phospholipid phosphatase